MEETTKAKLAAVNEAVKSSVIIGTVDVIAEDDVMLIDLIEECNGEVVRDRNDMVGFPLSEHLELY